MNDTHSAAKDRYEFEEAGNGDGRRERFEAFGQCHDLL